MPATQFEKTVAQLKLKPHQYVGSKKLREWALRNMRSCYIPEELLAAWRLQVEEEAEASESNKH